MEVLLILRASSPSNYTTPHEILTNSTLSAFSKIVRIYSTDKSFAALREDNSVIVWGHNDYGGETPLDSNNFPILISNVNYVKTTKFAFAILKNDKTVTLVGPTKLTKSYERDEDHITEMTTKINEFIDFDYNSVVYREKKSDTDLSLDWSAVEIETY